MNGEPKDWDQEIVRLLGVLPQFPSPFRWLGVTERPEDIHVAFFDIGPFARGNPSPHPPTRLSEIFSSLSDYYPPPGRASRSPAPSCRATAAASIRCSRTPTWSRTRRPSTWASSA